ncbi:MAG: hypothetical protein KGI83_07115, partial [Verrucomicrobiota bacterium]|nr:hypothetical protein [Verrucomicrobiota bacterium]
MEKPCQRSILPMEDLSNAEQEFDRIGTSVEQKLHQQVGPPRLALLAQYQVEEPVDLHCTGLDYPAFQLKPQAPIPLAPLVSPALRDFPMSEVVFMKEPFAPEPVVPLRQIRFAELTCPEPSPFWMDGIAFAKESFAPEPVVLLRPIRFAELTCPEPSPFWMDGIAFAKESFAP